MSNATNPFDRGASEAAAYDAWYDSAAGAGVLRVELRCVAELLEGAERPWLEVGTGSGRFGGALGVDVGLDPARAFLRIASRRVPSVVRGVAEALPFRSASAGAVVVVATLEFVADPAVAIREVARVLRRGGRLVLGFMPRGSSWADAYEEQGRDSHSVFHGARFFTAAEVEALAAAAGLETTGARSCLFEGPGAVPSERVETTVDASAGFAAIALTKRR
jgi:ubiquinone/menaquinone biosynthesis C-methylase UbiE